MLTIRNDIHSGDIERIVARHRVLYEKEFGFDHEFGDYVEKTLNDPYEKIWIAELDGTFAGCIGLVETDAKTVQLRWFLVEPEARGKGVGKKLITAFLDYSRLKKYDNIYLWTVNILPAARKIYEEFGFYMAESKPKTMLWGKNLSEQRWEFNL